VAVEVGVVRVARLHAGLHKRLAQRVGRLQIAHLQRPSAPCQQSAPRCCLRPAENRAAHRPAPARVACGSQKS
jgi:hypothetical protein